MRRRTSAGTASRRTPNAVTLREGGPMAALIPELVEGLPTLCGWEAEIRETVARRGPASLNWTPIRLGNVTSAFGIALHMHQPLVLGDGDLQTARVIGNLEYMMERRHVHGFHDAPAFLSCYSRIADIVRDLVDAGRNPR